MERTFLCDGCGRTLQLNSKERYIQCPFCEEYDMTWVEDIIEVQ